MSAPTSIACGSKNARGNNNGVDRLSSLCDDLLHHVMSFLPMPEVVRTSLLSPWWRSLWASTPFIHIDDEDFEDENKPSCVDEDKLEMFGNNLLLLRDGAVCLDEARIFVLSGDGSRKSSVWIRHAIKHKVRLLHVSGSVHFPSLDSTAVFPSQHLKRIRLNLVSLSHGFFRSLNYGCPVLGHLKLESCSLCDNDVTEISSRSLKVLHMICCYNNGDLVICARNLTHLSILDPTCDGAIVTRDLSFLVTASVIISSEELHSDVDTIVDGHRLLDGLSHATTLELDAPLHELAFESGLQTCPTFSNLTSLVLGDWCMAGGLYPLLRILQRSSKLKELVFKLKMEECSICKDSEYALSPSGDISSGTGSYLSIESIKICCLKDDPRVSAVVQALRPIINPDGKISIERC